jgi:taurine dioxygenase
MSIKVAKLSSSIGAALTGIDLGKPMDEKTFEEVHQAWLDNVILVFPGQDLTDGEQEAFARQFGELEDVRTGAAVGNDHPNVMMITNVKDTGRPTALEDGEMMFHYDQCYYEHPCMGATLFAIEVPNEGGNTLFSNCAAAYDALSDEWKSRLEGLKALNYYDYHHNPTARPEDLNPDAPKWVHPVIRTHSLTGRKAIYVNRLMTLWIEDMDRAESDEILGFLFDHIEKPEFIYEHMWTPGDLMMWDNRCSVHARTYFSPDARRMMRRVTIRDPLPVQ